MQDTHSLVPLLLIIGSLAPVTSFILVSPSDSSVSLSLLILSLSPSVTLFVLISFLIFWLLTLSFPCLLLSSSFLLLLIYPCIPFHLPPSDSSLPVSLLIVCLSLSVTLYILISLLIFCFLTLPFPCLFSCSPYLLLFLVSLLILRLPTPPFHSLFRLFQPGVERLSGEEKNARDCYADSPLIW